MMRALVTGGAGFIGSHVARLLLRQGWEVRVLDDLTTGSWSSLGEFASGCELLKGDIRDRQRIREACRGVDRVFHLAAMVSVADSVSDPTRCESINVQGTITVLEAAQECGVGRVVFTSSASVYGNAEKMPVTESDPILPLSPYAASKARGEQYCRLFSDNTELETVALRYFNVYGPGQTVNGGYAAVIPAFIDLARHNREPVLFGDGEQTRDFVFVEDVARANLAAATRPGVSGRSFNIGTGRGVSLLDLLRELRKITGSALIPSFLAPRAGDVRHSTADVTRAAEELGFHALCRLDEGLLRTVLHAISASRGGAKAAA